MSSGVSIAAMRSSALLIALCCLAAGQVSALTYTGRVVKVADGDTITMLVEGHRQVKIRLSEIDAPESKQPYGKRSKALLSELVFGKLISAQVNDVDRYGRSVARLSSGRTDVNAEMVKQGAAWAYTRYQSDGRFAMWERNARAARLGLWGLQRDQIKAPWEWRAAKRGVPAISTTAQATQVQRTASGLSSSTGFSCTKRYCRQMASCEEAVHGLGLLLRHLQPLLASDTLDALAVYDPTRMAQQRGHPAIAVPPVLLGQRDDVFSTRPAIHCRSYRWSLRRTPRLPANRGAAHIARVQVSEASLPIAGGITRAVDPDTLRAPFK